MLPRFKLLENNKQNSGIWQGEKRLVATFVDDTGQMELVWFQVINGFENL
jgi:hypothetical protein